MAEFSKGIWGVDSTRLTAGKKNFDRKVIDGGFGGRIEYNFWEGFSSLIEFSKTEYLLPKKGEGSFDE